MKTLIKYLIDCHKFFIVQSQFYILGNWTCYTYDRKKLAKYYIKFPIAYCKFMFYSIAYYCSLKIKRV